MKQLLLAILVFLTVSSCTQVNDLVPSTDDSLSAKGATISAASVPATVMNAFTTKYPTAGGEIEWQKEDGNTYKVKFWLGAERWQAIFSSTGSFLSEKRLK
ncbi:hypothetical protein IQ13_2311 [Lacibacter cauensis]|uniref:PepSY-like beta-lactamase-inhibitor n=1 Tax=Lacibacter cauensis TaxID=510947 RepID=A0A562SJX6_9BACT|nr:hypothetical protein [Lacibacter cauensis]TWI81294.1 hypothetical protein IQ13_2311 [Lacibacter cauensis]